jgi:hypothetical protein
VVCFISGSHSSKVGNLTLTHLTFLAVRNTLLVVLEFPCQRIDVTSHLLSNEPKASLWQHSLVSGLSFAFVTSVVRSSIFFFNSYSL